MRAIARGLSRILPTVVMAWLIVMAFVFATAVNAPRAQAARSCLYFEFVKSTNTNSTLYWRWMDDYGRCIYSASWRAGSGVTTDPCQLNAGWLPNGWYDLKSTGHQDSYSGTSIWGRVWSLQDKACSNGTLRTQLFIHTEETSSRTQICSSDPDDPQCWDSTKAPGDSAAGTNDFRSEGCIKVRRQSPEGSWPDAMSAVDSDWHAAGLGQASGRTDTVYVHS